MASYLIVANWKMYFTYAQAVAWARLNQQELQHLARDTEHKLVLCPSYEALSGISDLFEKTKIAVGAQDCSSHKDGAYTGQIAAQSLKEVGCSYCIIGHSETRRYQNMDNHTVAHKAAQALNSGLTPIICIGEDRNAYEAKKTFHVITEQLVPVLEAYKNNEPHLIIAYEPVWAIGTGDIPKKSYLDAVYAFIIDTCAQAGIKRIPILPYGGSVDPDTVQDLCQVRAIQGFLIGGASTDFQKFKKIVQLI